VKNIKFPKIFSPANNAIVASFNNLKDKIKFDTGQTPVYAAILASFLIIAVIIGVCMILGPAKHIIMGDFAYADPTSTTAIIIVYSLLATSIFLNEVKIIKNKDNTIEIPTIVTFMQMVVSVLPLFTWLLVLLWNDPVPKWGSLIITVIAIISNVRFFSDDDLKKEFDTEKFMHVMMSLVVLILGYNSLLYLFNCDFLDNNYRAQNNHTFRTISGVSGILCLFYILPQIPELFNKNKILMAGGLIISLFLFSQKGAINTLDILLVFGLFIRMVIFGSGFTLRLLKSIYDTVKGYFKVKNDEDDKNIAIKRVNIIDLLKITPFLIFLSLVFCGKNHEIHEIQTHHAVRNKMFMEEYITKWINARSDNNDPIVLISGQGGGSRAGCAFYSAMSVLDTLAVTKNNILAMTTISGSSNGAGFYLIGKKIGHQFLHSDDAINQLYTKDYISMLLFRLLFWDPLIAILPARLTKKFNWVGRNKFLPNLEEKAAREAFDIPEDAKTLAEQSWSDIYPGDDSTTENDLPLFLPASYNFTYSLKALSTPYPFREKPNNDFYSILDSLGENQSITIGESILLSQLFPVVNASAIIGSNSAYIDGGVYDNYGFETLLDLYEVVSKLRYKVAPKKSILIIPVLNSSIFNDSFQLNYKNNLINTITAVSSSIFISNPSRNLALLNHKLKDNGDHIEMLEIFNKGLPSLSGKPKNRDKNNWFKYAPDSTKVMMSRYLHSEEIVSLKKMATKEIQSKIVNGAFKKSKHTFLFDYGRSMPDREAQELLKNISNDCNDKCIDIVGYSDIRGKAAYNTQLALNRAKEIKSYLKKFMKGKPAGIAISSGAHPNFKEGIFERIYDRKCIISIDTL
jgi:outer membrane protein OmpA-like peptidoglycan-associated protein